MLGLSLTSLALGLNRPTGSSVPANAVRDRTSDPVKDRASSVIVTRLAFLATVSALTAIGTISGGSDALALTSNPGFQVGDYVIVETGGEAGAGLRGTKGVGGVWPSLSYADATAMNADTGQALNRMSWVEATGDVYYWNGSAWVQPAASDYYNRKAVPKALVAQVTNVSGTTLTLDKVAATTATNANVYYDNWGIIMNLIGAGVEVDIPAGTYAVSDHLYVTSSNVTIHGAGKTATTLKTPFGASHGGIFIEGGSGCMVHDLTLDCNFKEERYSFRWDDGRAVARGSTNYFSEFYRTAGWAYGQGIHFRQSNDSEARNVRVINPAQHAVTTSLSYDCWAYNCTAVIEEPMRAYTQWMFQWTDIYDENRGGGCVDCDVDSNFLVPGFNAFRTRDVTFTRPVMRNALFANNGSDGILVDEPVITIEANSKGNSFVNEFYPIMEFSVNVSGGFNTKPGTIRNPTLVQEGYIDGTKRLICFAVASAACPVLLEGTYDTDPTTPKGLFDVQVNHNGGNPFGGIGVRVGGTVTINGLRIKSVPSDEFRGGIHSEGGTVTVTDSIFDPDTVMGTGTFTQSGNMTNAEYEALP